jgi:excisionase family DNA binding protein
MEDYYTTGEAARILKVTEARVRQMLGAGELEGTRDPVSDRWRIPQRAVHARLEQRRPSEAPRTSADAREWIERARARLPLGRPQRPWRRRYRTLVSSSWLGKGTRRWTRGPSSSQPRFSGSWKVPPPRRRSATSSRVQRDYLIHQSAWKLGLLRSPSTSRPPTVA